MSAVIVILLSAIIRILPGEWILQPECDHGRTVGGGPFFIFCERT